MTDTITDQELHELFTKAAEQTRRNEADLVEFIEDLHDFLDKRQDADGEESGWIANPEMSLLIRLDELRERKLLP